MVSVCVNNVFLEYTKPINLIPMEEGNPHFLLWISCVMGLIVGISLSNKCCIDSTVNKQRPEFDLASFYCQDGLSSRLRMKKTCMLKMGVNSKGRVQI